jgi:DNA-binding MarR family transcriptional regulator
MASSGSENHAAADPPIVAMPRGGAAPVLSGTPDTGDARPPPEIASDFTPRLRMATMRLARLLRQHADPGLSQTMISALATIARCGPVTLGRLAELESVQPPSMTRIVAKLEEHDLVVRAVDAADRRVARVSLTAAAEDLLAGVRTRRNELLARRLTALDADDLAALEAALPALERLAEVPR